MPIGDGDAIIAPGPQRRLVAQYPLRGYRYELAPCIPPVRICHRHRRWQDRHRILYRRDAGDEHDMQVTVNTDLTKWRRKMNYIT
jgi:hypothetical protein